MSTVLVGDPVDVLTGAQFDVALDFLIRWRFPFEWRRFYSTARVTERLPLGWGHTHWYDHRLKYDLNGLLYVAPDGTRHGFLYPEKVGAFVLSGTDTLRRVETQTFQVKVGGFPECEFQFTDPASPARLTRVFQCDDVHELRYGKDGRWSELVYASEPVIGIESDPSGRIRALIWRGAREGRDRVLWEGTYDAAGNLTRVADPYHTIQSFEYDGVHRMVGRRDRRGYGFVASYDTAGRCERSAGEDGMQEVRLQYIPEENLTVVSRADGGASQYFYQPEGVARIVDPYGGVTQRIYGAGGRLEGEIGPEGEVLQELVDVESGLLRPPFPIPSGMCLPSGDRWFDAVRRIEVPRDALGWDGYGESRPRQVIRFPSRDAAWLRQLPSAVTRGIRFAEQPGEGEEEEPPLPPRGGTVQAPERKIGVPGYPGTMRYDPFGLLLSHTLPGGHTCRWQYDPNGNVIAYTDYAGSEWRYDYASWNLRVSETDPLGHTTSYQFNQLEKPVRISDPGGTSTRHSFDLKDRLTERLRHDELRDRFGYDRSDGLIAIAAGGDGTRIALTLGEHRRPVEIMPSAQPLRRCAYDEHAQLLSVAAEDGTVVEFAYDEWGDLTLDLQNGRGVRREFEASSLIESVVLGKFATQYREDGPARRTTIVDPMGGRHVVQRFDSGVVLRQHPNGTEELAQFDWKGRCLARNRFRPAEPYTSWARTYRYSPIGALVSAEDSESGTWAYGYDAAHRLTGVTPPTGSGVSFSYDAAGNLIGAPGLEGVSLAENRLMSANGYSFEYNQRHNVVRQSGGADGWQYEYDAEDRLVACEGGGRRAMFRYDALGRRLAKTTDAGTTEFIWDGERLAAEISPDRALRVYLYADVEGRTPFAFIDYESEDAEPGSGQRRYVFSNQISCPVRVEDESGAVLWHADIDAYGRATIQPNATIELNLRWPGHYFDPETGLQYNRHRYYSPVLGRYIQVDPRDLEGGINVYAYAARPLDLVDVDGLAPCKKKAMVEPDEDDPKFQAAKKKADKIANDLIAALEASKMHPLAKAGRTLTTMVVLGKNGKYEVVVTGNSSKRGLPRSVKEAMGGARYIGYGDDAPPPVRQEDKGLRNPRDNPRTGERDPTTHKHAEQRGLRATDCDDDTKGVAYIAPTRPCCEGCSKAIQKRGGTGDNVSDLGKQEGDHGNWWQNK